MKRCGRNNQANCKFEKEELLHPHANDDILAYSMLTSNAKLIFENNEVNCGNDYMLSCNYLIIIFNDPFDVTSLKNGRI